MTNDGNNGDKDRDPHDNGAPRVCSSCEHALLSYEIRGRVTALERREMEMLADRREYRDRVLQNQETIGRAMSHLAGQLSDMQKALSDVQDTVSDLVEAVWAA